MEFRARLGARVWATSRNCLYLAGASGVKHEPMKTLLLLGATLFSLLDSSRAFAGSATWKLNPSNGDWNKPANWTPATVPNGPGDIATFDFSNRPSVALSASTEANSLVFNPGAAIYLISPKPGNVLTISGTGIINNSGQLQSFETSVDQYWQSCADLFYQ